MSNLPGNPHFAWAADTLESLEQAEGTYLNPDEHALQTASVEATLALAYEQRTANLIAVFGNMMDGEVDTFLGERIDGYELAKQIQERLCP